MGPATWVWLTLLLTSLAATCPPACDCKWKSGKDSAICVNGNLTRVPQGLHSSLQMLDLSINFLGTLQVDAFSEPGLLNLQRLYLNKCRIRNLDRFAFRGLTNLVELDLSGNLISSVPSHTFDSIPELRELKLSGNPVQRLANDAFRSVPRLVKLELSECRLSTLEPRAFAALEESLAWLKINDNRLVEVRAFTLTVLKKLQGLELSGNPWNCSCRLRPLKLWASSRKISFSSPPSCKSPPRLAGKTWDRLEDAEFACHPSIVPLGPHVRSVEGSNVTLTCTVSGSPAPDVRWLWKNRPLANHSLPSHRKVYILSHNSSRSSLTIYSAELHDAGVYFCLAANRAGRAQSNVTLAVQRRKSDSVLTMEVICLGAGGAVLFLLLACLLFLYFGRSTPSGGGKPESIQNHDRYEKIELKVDNCYPRLAPNDCQNKVHPKNCEYRGLPLSEEQEEETSQSSLLPRSNHSTASRETGSGGGGLSREVSWVQEHILRKEVFPTTSLYTTAPPANTVDLEGNYPDLLTQPQPLLSPPATLPRHSGKNWLGSSSQSPLLAGSRCGSSAGESSMGGGRRCSIESRSSSYYPRWSNVERNPQTSERSRCERSASSLDLFEAEAASWRRPSLPSSPIRHRPTSQATETPILNLLGSAVYDFHAAELERFLEEYRSLQDELNRMKETCEGLTSTPDYPVYSDLYRSQ